MPGPKGEKVSAALGVGGGGLYGPWLLGHSVGIQLQLLPQFIIPHISFFPARGSQEGLESQEIREKM